MNSQFLFGPPIPTPAGFGYKPDFISPQEEQALIGQVAALPLAPYQYGEYEARRRVCNFGEGELAFPDWLLKLRGKAAVFAKCDPESIVQAHIIEYSPGSRIGWHRDAPPYEMVIGISLAGSCRFQLRRKLPNGKWDRFEIEALPRSIYVMKGPARSQWQHGIPPVDHLRYSITLRTR
jgi:hypothetical protein